MKLRTLIISDIHGCRRELDALLERMAYDPVSDRLILLGDLVDKGPDSMETVERAMQLCRDHGAIVIQGNHDERLAALVRGDDPTVASKFLEHGGIATMASYAGSECDPHDLDAFRRRMESRFAHHLDFLAGLPLYEEDEDHIFVHAGLNPAYADWREQPRRDFLYIKEPFYAYPTRTTKTVVFGHTRATDLHGSPDIWFAADKIGIDGGCAYGRQLNGLEIRRGSGYRAWAIQRMMGDNLVQ